MCALILPGIGMAAVMLFRTTIIDLIIFVVIITHLPIAGTSTIISRFGRIGSIIGLVHSVFAGGIFEPRTLKWFCT